MSASGFARAQPAARPHDGHPQFPTRSKTSAICKFSRHRRPRQGQLAAAAPSVLGQRAWACQCEVAGVQAFVRLPAGRNESQAGKSLPARLVIYVRRLTGSVRLWHYSCARVVPVGRMGWPLTCAKVPAMAAPSIGVGGGRPAGEARGHLGWHAGGRPAADAVRFGGASQGTPAEIEIPHDYRGLSEERPRPANFLIYARRLISPALWHRYCARVAAINCFWCDWEGCAMASTWIASAFGGLATLLIGRHMTKRVELHKASIRYWSEWNELVCQLCVLRSAVNAHGVSHRLTADARQGVRDAERAWHVQVSAVREMGNRHLVKALGAHERATQQSIRAAERGEWPSADDGGAERTLHAAMRGRRLKWAVTGR